MKRLKYFLTVACLLFSMMALSSVAIAYDPLPGNIGEKPFFACAVCGKSGYHEIFNVLYFEDDSRCLSDGLFYYVCSSCGKFVSMAFGLGYGGHLWSRVVGIPSTCITMGRYNLTCSRCNATKTETIPALGHDYVSNRTEPTCTTPGSIVSTCSRCGDTITEAIPALGHEYSVSARTEPTCTTPGSIVSTCSRCNDTITEELPVSYHSWDTVEMVPSVYDDNGSIVTEGYTFYTCSICGSHYTAVAGTSPPAAGLVSDSLGGEGMPDTTAALGKTFLSGLWSLFAITVPGFSFTFGQMWLGVLLASISILVIRMIFGFGGGPRGESPRTSSTSNPRISKERRRDEL